ELRAEGVDLPDYPRMVRHGLTEEQKRNHARGLNVLRRQLTKEQRDQIMVDMRRDGMSQRQIAEAVGVTQPTVHNVLSRAGDKYLSPEFVTGADGKTYPAQQRPKPEPPVSLFVPGDTVALDHDAAERQVNQARQERTDQRRQERVEKINEIAQGNTPLQA